LRRCVTRFDKTLDKRRVVGTVTNIAALPSNENAA